MKEITMYEKECTGGCRKTKIVKDKYDTFTCSNCKNSAIQPNVEFFEDATSLLNAIIKYEYLSGKRVSYDSYEAIKELAKRNTKIPKKYVDKCWDYANQRGHSSGIHEVLGIFTDLEDIFN